MSIPAGAAGGGTAAWFATGPREGQIATPIVTSAVNTASALYLIWAPPR